MIRAPRTIAIVKRIFMFPVTEEKRDRTTSFQSNSTRIVSRSFFLNRWFCSFPSSTVKISRVGRSIMGIGENEHSGIKLRAKRRLFLLTLMEWKMPENATNYDDHFQAASVFCWKKWKRQCHRSMGIITYVFSGGLVLKNKRKNEKKTLDHGLLFPVREHASICGGLRGSLSAESS